MSSTQKPKRGKGTSLKNMRIVYPEYFDSNLSWRMGRRVSNKLAFDNPELKRVALAAQKAGYEVFLDADKHYSRNWYEKRGRILINKSGSKEKQLREIARNLSKVNLPKPQITKKKEEVKKVKKGSVYRQKPK